MMYRDSSSVALGRIWYEMRGTKTVLADQCE